MSQEWVNDPLPPKTRERFERDERQERDDTDVIDGINRFLGLSGDQQYSQFEVTHPLRIMIPSPFTRSLAFAPDRDQPRLPRPRSRIIQRENRFSRS